MSQKPLIELRNAMRAKANEMMDAGGLTTGQLVLRINEDLPESVGAAQGELAQIGLQRIAQAIMHHPNMAAGDARQGSLKLPYPPRLARMDPPEAISVPVKSNSEDDDDEVRWLPFRSARLSDILAYIEMLQKQIQNDRARVARMSRIARYLEPSMKANPNATVEDILRGAQP